MDRYMHGIYFRIRISRFHANTHTGSENTELVKTFLH